MTENKRYIDDGFEAIEEQSFTDTETDKTYYVDYFYKIIDLLNEQDKRIKELEEENKELREDNDIKFWKLQCMQQHNSAQVILHELSLAIKQGYEVSDRFKKYTDDLESNNKKMIEKNKRLFGESE